MRMWMTGTTLFAALTVATLTLACDVDENGRPPGAYVFGEGDPPPDQPEPVAIDESMSKIEVAELAAAGAAAWTEDICELNTNDAGQNWYQDDECDWYCPLPDAACEAGPIGPDPEGTAALYPFILVHGFMNKGGSFVGLEDALRADGHAVELASLPPVAPVRVRAEYLANEVDEALALHSAAKVNIIAHSMGGLDARYLVDTLGYGDRVASITTIATPHRGSTVADTALGWTNAESAWVSWIAEKLVGLVEGQFDEFQEEDVVGALEDLSTMGTAEFNIEVVDDPAVFYQSWAGVSSPIARWQSGVEDECGDVLAAEPNFFGFGNDRMALQLIPLSKVVGGINDGVVSVHSAKWGRMRGCIPADHQDQVRKTSSPVWITGYDAGRFLRGVAYGLAKRGY